MTPERSYLIVSRTGTDATSQRTRLLPDDSRSADQQIPRPRANAALAGNRRRTVPLPRRGEIAVFALHTRGAGRHRIGTPGLWHFAMMPTEPDPTPRPHRSADGQANLGLRTAAIGAGLVLIISGWYATSGALTLVAVVAH